MSATAKLTLIQGGNANPTSTAPVTRRVKRAAQEDQFPVNCGRTPAKHADLRGLPGLLTIEFRRGKPWEATFDPDDASIDNAIMPVLAIGAKGKLVIVSSDEGRWVFEDTTAGAEEDEDDDEDSR